MWIIKSHILADKLWWNSWTAGKLFLHQCVLILNCQLFLPYKGNFHLHSTQGPSAAHCRGFISYSITNWLTLTLCNKQLCKNVVSSPQVLVRKKNKKQKWGDVLCCFSRSCFIQTENNISYDNKQNKYMTMSNTPSCAVSHVTPLCFECQSLGIQWLHSPGYRRSFRPFFFDSTKQLREEDKEEEGEVEEFREDGARGWWTLCRFGLCMFSAHCPFCRNWKF